LGRKMSLISTFGYNDNPGYDNLKARFQWPAKVSSLKTSLDLCFVYTP